MRLFAPITVVVSALTLAACTYSASVSGSNEELNAEAEAVYEELVTERYDAIAARMSSANDVEQVRAQLPMLRQMVGHDTAPSPEVVSSTTGTTNAGDNYSVEQAYTYADRVVTTRTDFLEEDNDWRVQSFNVDVQMTAQAEGGQEGGGSPG